jgi:dienelactone hydrolase
MAGVDDFFAPEAARALEAKLAGMGKDVEFTIHDGAGHGFMNPQNALGTQDEVLAAKVWAEVVAFLHDQLG